MHLLNTLYVTLPDSHLRLDNDTLRVLVGDDTRLWVETTWQPCLRGHRRVARPSRGARGLKQP